MDREGIAKILSSPKTNGMIGLFDPRNYKSGASDDFFGQLARAVPQLVGGAVKNTYNNMDTMDKAALATSPIPIVGDAMGLANDARYLAKDPSLANAGMMAAGALPFVPSLGMVKKIGSAASKSKIEKWEEVARSNSFDAKTDWEVRRLPISEIKPMKSEFGVDDWKPYLGKPTNTKDLSDTPIKVSKDGFLMDGNHRLAEAINRGDEDILVMVPTTKTWEGSGKVTDSTSGSSKATRIEPEGVGRANDTPSNFRLNKTHHQGYEYRGWKIEKIPGHKEWSVTPPNDAFPSDMSMTIGEAKKLIDSDFSTSGSKAQDKLSESLGFKKK